VITIVDLALLPGFRGRGVGSLLIGAILEEAAEKSLPVHVEVPKRGDILERCERLGFRCIEDSGERWHLVWHPRLAHLRDRAAYAG
jgi:GNAT superfamily N-acetyltransferase